MSVGRQLGDGNNVGSNDHNNSSEDSQPLISDLIKKELEVMVINTVQRVVEPMMEGLIRKVVKEEFNLAHEKLLTSINRNPDNEGGASETRALQLKFIDGVTPTVLSGKKIEGKECTSLRVALVDALTGQVVKSGPEATTKVELVVLKGDFGGGEGDDCSLEEFNKNIVRTREGGIPILRGNTSLKLKEGIAAVDVKFPHTKCWLKKCKFRLGAIVVDSFLKTTVRKAKTEPFSVKDCRINTNEKGHPLKSVDQVSQLKKIGKASHKRLLVEGINTVKDFISISSINPRRLQQIVGVGAKTWNVIMEHARTCEVDEGRYLYYTPESDQKIGVVFDTKGQVMELLEEGLYVPFDELSENQKADAHKLVISASENWKVVGCVNDNAYIMHGSFNSPYAFPLSYSPRLASPNDHEFGSSLINQNDHTTHINPLSINGVEGTSNLDGNCFINISDMDFIYEEPLVQYYGAGDAVSICKAQKSWTMVYNFLRGFLAMRRKIGAPEGIRGQKRQRCC